MLVVRRIAFGGRSVTMGGRVGACDGTAEGDAVGALVGVADGAAEGALVGLIGAAVGLADGDAVGAIVGAPHLQPPQSQLYVVVRYSQV